MSSMSVDGSNSENNNRTDVYFVKWEILQPIGEQPNLLSTIEPLTVRFALKVGKSIQNGHHGISLFNSDGQLMWGTGVDNLRLQQGMYEFVYTLEALPLRPGIYYWIVTVFEDGQLIERWHCTPEFVVAIPPLGHMKDEWAGILNFRYDFVIRKEDDVILITEGRKQFVEPVCR